MNQPRSLTSLFGIIFLMIITAALVWSVFRFTENNTSGEGFSIEWTAIHSLVKDANSPYSEEVTNKIREAVKVENSFTRESAPRYSSPLFSGIVVLPAALIENRSTAHALWSVSQLIAIISVFMISQRINHWKPTWYIYFLFILLSILSYHVAIPWLDGGLSIWAAFFLALVFLSIRNNWNEMGGIFLGLSAIQPQMTILVIIFTLIWAGTQKRRILIFWFFMTIILLSILAVFLVPDWIIQYTRLLYNYSESFPAGSPSALFIDLWPGLGKQLGLVLSIILGILLIFESWFTLKKEFRHYLWTACLVIVITQWIGIPTIPANLSGLLLPLILIAAMLTERWPRRGQWIPIILVTIIFAIEWLLFYQDVTGPKPGTQMNLLIPFPLFLLIGLYWVRWLAIRPRRMLLEELRSAQTY